METNKIIILDMLPTSTGKLHSSSRIVDGGGYRSYYPCERLQRPNESIGNKEREF